MPLELYNTLSRKKEPLSKPKGKPFLIYNCGPTVYDFAHIGNLRTFALQDLVNRYLRYTKGFKVKLVMNITDVDDKTIKASQEKQISLGEFTKKFAEEFKNDTALLGMLAPDKIVFATQEIPEMVKLISGLLKKGFAYKSPDGSVYFDVKKFTGYGKLSKLKLKSLKAGVRVDNDSYEKNEARDFALWKAWQQSDGKVFWDAPFGKGRPGWHIECSAMSLKHLGEKIDLHGGGIDLIFPHHENEIAQSESYTGKEVVMHWFHSNHLIVNGRKMSKSLGNFYTLKDLKDYDVRAIRFLFFSAHYRDELNFTLESLAQAQKTIESLDEFVQKILATDGKENAKETEKILSAAKNDFEKNLDNDLDTPKMIAGLHSFIREMNKLLDKQVVSKEGSKKIISTLKEINEVLGVFKFEFAKESLSKEEKELVEKRETLRREKKFREADEVREILLSQKGIKLDDTPQGLRWKRVK